MLISQHKANLIFAMALVVATTVLTFAPLLHNGFVNYDDIDYVTANAVVQQGLSIKGLIWAFTSNQTGNWHPLSWLSHMLDVQMYGLNPAGHHLTSFVLHLGNALLLLAFLLRLTGFVGRSLIVSLLFALHPLHVESVAWVAERKDVLSMFFWLLTMGAYLRYCSSPRLTRYLVVVTLFAFGLMAKQMLVTLPFVLLLIDYWQLNSTFVKNSDLITSPSRTIQFLFLEKLPLFAMSIVMSYIAIRTQNAAGALSDAVTFPLQLRVGNSILSYLKYLEKMFLPIKLAVIYPFDPAALSVVKVCAAGCLLTLITVIVVRQRMRRPYLVFGWFWYLVTLLPVIGLLQVGAQAFADRYTYIPLVGLFIILAWGGAELAVMWRYGRTVAITLTIIVIIILSTLSNKQLSYWENNYTLFQHTLAVTEKNWVAHNNMGMDLSRQQKFDEAIGHFLKAVRFNPQDAIAYENLGKIYLYQGEISEAITVLREAVRINPNLAEARCSLGYAYIETGALVQAYEEYLQLRLINRQLAESLEYAINRKR
jgi:tetratricopeptide (TPR) repeat protein